MSVKLVNRYDVLKYTYQYLHVAFLDRVDT